MNGLNTTLSDHTITGDIITYRGKQCVIISGQILPIIEPSFPHLSVNRPIIQFQDRTYYIHDISQLNLAPGRKHCRPIPSSFDSPLLPSSPNDRGLPRTLARSDGSESSETSSSATTSPRTLCSQMCNSSPVAWSYSCLNRGKFMSEAALSGNLELIKLLCSLGCSIEEGNSNRFNIAVAAALQSQLPILNFLVSQGVNLMLETVNSDFTIAHAAAQGGNVEALDLAYRQCMAVGYSPKSDGMLEEPVIREGFRSFTPNLNAKGSFSDFLEILHGGRTASMLAAMKQHINVLDWLRQHGDRTLDFSSSEHIGPGIVSIALQSENLAMLEWLKACGYPLEAFEEMGDSIAHVAAMNRKLQVLQWLGVHFGQLFESLNASGETPLLSAASYGHLDAVAWMHAQGASLYARTSLGRTAAHLAAAGGHLALLTWLAEQGCDIRERTYLGYTLACMAAKAGHVHILEWLGAQHAELTHIVHDGTTPILQATFFGHLPVLKWMKRNGLALDERYNEGMTLVHYAARAGHLHILQWLAAQGLSLTALTYTGQSPLAVAHAAGQASTFLWLRGLVS